MKPILNFFAESYLALPIMMVCQLIASLVGYRYKNKHVELKYFHLYPIASFFQVVVCLISLYSQDKKMGNTFMEVSINVFVFLEAILIYNILCNVITITRLKFILKAAL